MKKILFFIAALMTAFNATGKPLIDLEVKLHGEYSVNVIHADKSVDTYSFPNLITNFGLDAIGGTPTTQLAGYIVLSANNTPPSPTDGPVSSPLGIRQIGTPAETATPILTTAPGPYSYSRTVNATFAIGAIVGNVCKIARVKNNSVGDNPFSIALIMVAGSPVCITVVSTDQLIVSHKITVTLPADSTANFNVTTDGVVTVNTATFRPYGLVNNRISGMPSATAAVNENATGTCYSSVATTLQAVTSIAAISPCATDLSNSTSFPKSMGPYTPGTYYRDYNLTIPAGTARTIYGFSIPTNGPVMYGVVFATPITMTADQILTMAIRIHWNQT